jgi:hypothetical protein
MGSFITYTVKIEAINDRLGNWLAIGWMFGVWFPLAARFFLFIIGYETHTVPFQMCMMGFFPENMVAKICNLSFTFSYYQGLESVELYVHIPSTELWLT